MDELEEQELVKAKAIIDQLNNKICAWEMQ
jgi:hypothetical protein